MRVIDNRDFNNGFLKSLCKNLRDSFDVTIYFCVNCNNACEKNICEVCYCDDYLIPNIPKLVDTIKPFIESVESLRSRFKR